MTKEVLLAICDTPTVHTGFGNVIANTFKHLDLGKWDIHILGVNYAGDPHPLQKRYQLYPPTANGGDLYGFQRMKGIISHINPSIVFILNDPWMCVMYIQKLKEMKYKGAIVVYTPVDAPNLKREYVMPLNEAHAVVNYTNWAREEMLAKGLTTTNTVIPHGVNLANFHPVDKKIARENLYADIKTFDMSKAFVVTYVARNNPRKRVDLFLYTLKKWRKKYPHDNVFFHYHGAPKDMGIDPEQAAHYFGVDDRFIITSREMTPQTGVPEERMKFIFNSADVYYQVCAIEGWSLPLHEAMACRVPVLVPKFSALQDWPQDAPYFVGVEDTPNLSSNGLNTDHRAIDVSEAVEALERLYNDEQLRRDLADRAFAVATQKQFHWKNISKQFEEVFIAAIQKSKEQTKWVKPPQMLTSHNGLLAQKLPILK